MSDFVNIRPGTNQPLVLNTKNLSAVIRHAEQPEGNKPPKTTLAFYDAELGRQLWLDKDSWKIDESTMLSAIAGTGTALFQIPLVWAERKNYGAAFINPAAFVAIITSKPFIPDGETEECAAILLDVAGYGRVESYEVPVRVIEDFMAQVKNQKPHLMTVTPDTATSRWTMPGAVIFDRAAVSMIRPNGYDLDIYLDCGVTGKSRIDFNLKDGKGGDLYNKQGDYTTALLRRAIARGILTFGKMTDEQTRNLYGRAQRHFERNQLRLKESFAAAIAKDNTALLKIENAKDVNYVTPDDITLISARDNSMQINLRHAEKSMNDTLGVYFASADLAEKEAARLTALLCKPRGGAPLPPNCS
ncbi:MAG: hypothetical protein ACXW4B_08695 [Micavibrio sp.]